MSSIFSRDPNLLSAHRFLPLSEFRTRPMYLVRGRQAKWKRDRWKRGIPLPQTVRATHAPLFKNRANPTIGSKCMTQSFTRGVIWCRTCSRFHPLTFIRSVFRPGRVQPRVSSAMHSESSSEIAICKYTKVYCPNSKWKKISARTKIKGSLSPKKIIVDGVRRETTLLCFVENIQNVMAEFSQTKRDDSASGVRSNGNRRAIISLRADCHILRNYHLSSLFCTEIVGEFLRSHNSTHTPIREILPRAGRALRDSPACTHCIHGRDKPP